MRMPKLNPFRMCNRICLPSNLVHCTPVLGTNRVGVPAEQGLPPVGTAEWSLPPVINSIRSPLHQERPARQDDIRSPVAPCPSASPTETTVTYEMK